jgi:hypothetical protein
VSVMAVAKFERFFHTAASLDVDKSDLRRYNDFVNDKLYDLVVMGQATAKANVRDVLMPWDLPITKGLQESMHQFRAMDEEIELQPVLDFLAAQPPLDVTYADETRERLPLIVGGLSLALARAMKIVDPDLKTPQTDSWERTQRVFDLLL